MDTSKMNDDDYQIPGWLEAAMAIIVMVGGFVGFFALAVIAGYL